MANKKLKIIFAGTPEFSVPTLSALCEAEYQILLVLTQPDRKSGRGMHLKPSPVKQKAEEYDIPVFQADNLNNEDAFNRIRDINADVLIVAAYGLIIPTKILDIFAKGSYNIHASLLPAWRGAAPIHRAIEAGDSKIGATIMSVAPKLDTGDMIKKKIIDLEEGITTGEMTKIISKLGAKLIVSVVNDIEVNKPLKFTKQDESIATYANKISKSEARVIWKNVRSEEVVRKINALNPFPGVFCNFRGKIIKIWQANKANKIEISTPGKMYVDSKKNNLLITTVDGAIEIKEIQSEGKRKMTAKEFIITNKIKNEEFLS
jgi:methionyl-tRNA formyltransferase